MSRAPRSIPRSIFHPRLEFELVEDLRAQAAQVGMPLATYMEHVVAEAFAYDGPYLAGTNVLPENVAAEQLRRRASKLTRQKCTPPRHPNATYGIRLDQPLAEDVRTQADRLGVAYTSYLRAVLRVSAGHSATQGSGQLDLGLHISAGKGDQQKRAS